MAAALASDAVTDLVLEIFRLNGCLIASGDALVAKIGLTSARWQVLGAIAMQAGPAPAHCGRDGADAAIGAADR